MTKPHYTIKFPDLATPAIRRLIVKGQAKHPEDDWDERDVYHHVSHAFLHLVDYFFKGIRRDPETGESPLLHAACRLLMAVDLMERERIECGGE